MAGDTEAPKISWLAGKHRSRRLASIADPDPGSDALLTPGSGMGKKSGSGSGIRIRDTDPG